MGSILNLLGIPFHILSLEYFYFNSINTLRMAKYFGNKNKLTSVAVDIHDFDWSRFLRDFIPASESSIVVHSSGCLQYVNSQSIESMFFELSKFNLYGGCHLEGDAFTLFNDAQKKTFLAACVGQLENSEISFPMPELGMGEIMRRKAGINQFSYLDPSFRSSTFVAIENLRKIFDLDVNIFFPWDFLKSSPSYFVEWRLKRDW